MSQLTPPHPRPRPLSFQGQEGFRRENRLGDFEGNFPSTATTPRSEASDPLSAPQTPNRWSRISGEYTALDGSRDPASTKQHQKGEEDQPSIHVKEIRTDSDLSTVLGGESQPISENVSIRHSLRGIWPKLATHGFAVIVTMAVIQLSVRNVYWMDLHSPEEQISPGLTQGGALSFLQLAAKLHELLILASVSAIVIHTVQHHLTGRSGLPLGMIANAFELNSGQYLRQKSFWAILWTKDPKTGKRLPYVHFWLLTFFAMILVTLSGPSSAIAVIPSLNYFELHHPFDTPMLPYYVLNSTTELWPQTLTGGSLNAPDSGNNCSDPNSFAQQTACPAAGFRELYAWGGGLLWSNSDHGNNISFADDTGSTRRIVSIKSCNSTFHGRASGVSLNAAISGAFVTYWNFATKNFDGKAMRAAQPHIAVDPSTDVYAPRVEVMCNSYPNYYYNASNFTNTVDLQPNMTFPTFDGTVIPVPEWTYKYRHAQNGTNLTFVSLKGENFPSIGVVITLPVIEQINGTWTQATENVACSVFSQWIPIDAFYEPTINDQVSYTITAPLGNTCLNMPSQDTGRKPINTTISQEYANGINSPIAFVTGPQPAILGILNRFVTTRLDALKNASHFQSPIPGHAKGSAQVSNITEETSRRQRAKLISSFLAGAMTDGIARIAGSGTFPYSAPVFLLPERNNSVLQGRFPFTTATQGQDESLNTTNTPEQQGWVKLNPTFQRYGYGYRWQGSRTTQFGVCVLMVHVLCALGHMIWLVSGVLGGRSVVKAWESIPEILALALGSRKAPITEENVWKDEVAVRETEVGALEMVAGRENITGMEIPRANRRYPPLGR